MFESLLASGQLPNGTVRVVLEEQNVVSIQLPPNYCAEFDCPQTVIINGTQDAEYEIEGEYSGCVFTKYIWGLSESILTASMCHFVVSMYYTSLTNAIGLINLPYESTSKF